MLSSPARSGRPRRVVAVARVAACGPCRRAFSHNLWLNGKEIGEVDCSSWPSSEEWPNGGFGRPTGLGVAGYNSYSEFSKHGLICTFPSCVFHESRLPEGRFIAIKLVIFEKA